MRGSRIAVLALASAAFAVYPWAAHAQATGTTVQRGFAVDRFDPSERGSAWFALESLDLRGGARPAFGLVLDYGYRPLVLYGADGNVRVSLLRNQSLLHAGGNIVLADRLRLSADLPIAIYDHGRSAGAGSTFYEGPADAAGLGDLRFGADLRLVGAYGDPFTLALGGHVYIPSGSRSDYTSDGSVRVEPRLMGAGTVGVFTYAVRAGVMYRSLQGTFAGQDIGSELTFGASAGLRLGDDRVTLGPRGHRQHRAARRLRPARHARRAPPRRAREAACRTAPRRRRRPRVVSRARRAGGARPRIARVVRRAAARR